MASSLLEQRRQTVQRFFSLVSSGKWPAAMEVLAEDARWEILPSSVGSSRSRAQHLAYMEEVMLDFSSFTVSPQLVAADAVGGEDVFCLARSSAEHKLLGKYGQDYVFIFRFVEGRGAGPQCVTHVREFVDSLYATKFFSKVAKLKQSDRSKTAKL
eukprot:TRINITY_DN92087_c0_g1_i1.p1 TRINITY_DN92087_c0_g1~~TRINITY_DN92087_c0_g1_i1.p1  ORF type:complete len:156 (+),score=29.42 TRINITY_DN92087_c0_g1_i1:60-527(+)